jgi:hypothetical protein
MSKHPSKARSLLEVTTLFEPTRLAATHLADAYAQVAPLRSRSPRQPPEVTVETDAPAAQPDFRYSPRFPRIDASSRYASLCSTEAILPKIPEMRL